MKKIILIFFFSLAVCTNLSAQFTPSVIIFDTTITNTQGNFIYYFKNPFNIQLHVTNSGTVSQYFNAAPNSFTVNPLDSFPVTVTFNTNQNLTYRDFLFFNTAELNYPVINFIIATAKYSDTAYKFTQGLINEELKTALKNFTGAGYISLGYNLARDKMFEAVDDYGGDTIECVYTGRKIYAQNRTQAQNQGFNTEHTYPQSLFSQNEPMRSDLFHLYPTDDNANNERGNLDFGIVVSNITWQQGGSKKGNDYQNQIVFEPRDVHKGDVARALFYFVVRYNGAGIGNFLSLKQENVLRQWNTIDGVSARESLRNDRIKSFQNNRNPFIDHPEFVARVNSFYSTSSTVLKGRIALTKYNLTFDTLAVNDTSSFFVGIMNYGNGSLGTIITSNNSAFQIESSPSQIPAYNFDRIKIKFMPDQMNQTYTGEVSILNADTIVRISLTGYSSYKVGINSTSSNIPKRFHLYQNFPNPFNPSTIIKFDVAKDCNVKLVIYNTEGKEITGLLNEFMQPGSYEYEWKASELASGVYFYKISAGEFLQTRKMILLK